MSGPRLSIIPARAATDPALKPRDLQVLCVLGRHTDDLGWCRKSQVKMSEEMGCARSTVFEAVERLVKAGYLERYVQEEQSGRDSPHVYRVILDPKHADPGSVLDADSDALDPCRQVGTPAGISAPPAGPEPAPPAGPEPAPKNDPFRTTDSERGEKARTRDEDQKAVERWVKRTHPAWPSYVSDSVPKAVASAMALTPDERETAAERMADYLASAKVGGRTVICTFAVYLAEKRWEKLPPPVARPQAPDDYAPPFGPVWGAFVVERLLGGAHTDHVDQLYRLARLGRGYRFGERFQTLKPLMEAVPVGSAVFEGWRVEFERRAWPWIPDPGDQRVVYFPAGGPEALDAFEAAVQSPGSQVHEAAE
ncbi:helix-turn-helix domain-containing protein [Mesorhizobium sp. Root157]|uniref:helix-turn-helix domain-containing protein n=1 Tax=Mesorhizobium sp. Root157 TaxID=1736477 RepID=UPI000A95227A|nr:helix-turn-helix domain-containing protein [Mesorhizobium sp. Root157]